MPDGEIFALAPHLVAPQLVEEGPFGRLPYVEADISIGLAALGELLGVGSYDRLLDGLEENAQRANHADAWLVPIPTELRDALATVADVEMLAQRWAATDDFVDWTAEMVHELLRDLKGLAVGAKRDGSELWLWASL